MSGIDRDDRAFERDLHGSQVFRLADHGARRRALDHRTQLAKRAYRLVPHQSVVVLPDVALELTHGTVGASSVDAVFPARVEPESVQSILERPNVVAAKLWIAQVQDPVTE